jgi:hypothetical protein
MDLPKPSPLVLLIRSCVEEALIRPGLVAFGGSGGGMSILAASRSLTFKDWRKLFEIADHLGPPKLPTDNHDLVLIDAVELEYRLKVSMPMRTGTFTGFSSHLAAALKRHQAVGMRGRRTST